MAATHGGDNDYEADLRRLQIGLVRYQQWAIKSGAKALVIFEGRDGSGKDGTIGRVSAYMSARNTRVVALPKPTERDRSEWYFQRYIAHLPAGGEFVMFNRSWYNRASVEPVMGFCTPKEHAEFLHEVPALERMLEATGIRLVKLWLDISRAEQGRRLDERMADPLKQLKVSELDHVARKKWDAYTEARDEMLRRTHSDWAPWICVRADHKKSARLNVIRHLLHALAPEHVKRDFEPAGADMVFAFEPEALTDGRLAD